MDVGQIILVATRHFGEDEIDRGVIYQKKEYLPELSHSKQIYPATTIEPSFDFGI